ncbi:hypothetical protein 8014-B2_007 [Lactobacillus phage ATCC 8014-B2]|uniref:Uncharacterized protein n=1 Tax=Lactobacillus phage ATCC 8014-B2 TaxID=1225795 RepID=K4ID24_9CAUD|nr:hypothetical protein HOQ89_gp007 [Lactobacillus phage ATCC 8014-B2]AFU63074.1 hypothetical protein 8014-B2_007 [Lactobacillus phage ATCC 8014-B2]
MKIMYKKPKPTEGEVLQSGNVVSYDGKTCLVISKKGGERLLYGLVDLTTGKLIYGLMELNEFFERFSIDKFNYINDNTLVIH